MKLEQFLDDNSLEVRAYLKGKYRIPDTFNGKHVIGTCEECNGYPFASDGYCELSDSYPPQNEENDNGRKYGCIYWEKKK